MSHSIHFLFSKNDRIGSKIISLGTSFLCPYVTSPSHTAILVDNKWVFESIMTAGVRCISYKKWLTLNTEVLKVESSRINFKHVKEHFKNIKHKKYDFGGIIYLGYRLILYRLFNLHLPSINKLQSSNKYFCCEVVATLNNIDSQMLTPIQLMQIIRKKYAIV